MVLLLSFDLRLIVLARHVVLEWWFRDGVLPSWVRQRPIKSNEAVSER